MKKIILITIQILIGIYFVYINFPFKFYKEIDLIDGYAYDLCYTLGDTVKLHLNSSDSSDAYYFKIYNSTHEIFDSVPLTCYPQDQRLDSVSQLGKDYHQNAFFVITNKFDEGTYFLEDKIPFIINYPYDSVDITVVIPYFNVFAQKYKLIDSSVVSLKNLYEFDEQTIELLHYMDSLKHTYKIKFTTDVFLDSSVSYEKTKTIFMYGNTTFWTENARLKFNNFIQKGGNGIIVSAYIMNKVATIDNRSGTVHYNKQIDLSANWNNSQNSSYYSLGSCFNCGTWKLYTNNEKLHKKYHIISPKSPLLKDINISEINIKNAIYNFTPIYIIKNHKPIIDVDYIEFYKGEIIAYNMIKSGVPTFVSGINILKKNKESGIIINYGTESILNAENFHQATTRKLLDNGIDLLMSGKNVFTKNHETCIYCLKK